MRLNQKFGIFLEANLSFLDDITQRFNQYRMNEMEKSYMDSVREKDTFESKMKIL